MFRKLLDEGRAGDNVGLLLRGTKREDVERGQVVCKPGTVTPHKKFKCEVYVLSKDEGADATSPSSPDTVPQFYFRTTDVTGSIKLPDSVEMVMPGDNTSFEVDLITPIAMEKGLKVCHQGGGANHRSGHRFRNSWTKQFTILFFREGFLATGSLSENNLGENGLHNSPMRHYKARLVSSVFSNILGCVAPIGRAADSKSVGCRFESCHARPFFLFLALVFYSTPASALGLAFELVSFEPSRFGKPSIIHPLWPSLQYFC